MLNQDHANFLASLEASRVIGILRKCPAAHAPSIAAAATEAGIRIIEVTLDSESALDVISKICSRDSSVIVGAGTVYTAEQVRNVASAGGRFVASPMTSEVVVEAANECGLVALPGVGTTTEIYRALALGAPVVKVFPAQQLGGPGFLSAVRAPMLNPKMVPTGGVDISNAVAYLQAGAFAVGIGGSLFTAAALRDGDTQLITRETIRLMRELEKVNQK